MTPPSPAVFFSYSFKDAAWKDRLTAVLRNRGIDVWEDSLLRTGDDFGAEIHKAIDGARIAVLLISSNYLASDTIQKEQAPYLLASKKRLYPVLITACEWQKAGWLASIEMFPVDLRPLADADDASLHARLALAALEIASFSGIATIPQNASAKLMQPDGKYSGMATLARPDAAICIMGDAIQGALGTLEFPTVPPYTAQATTELVEQSVNLSLLRFATPVPWQVELSPLVPDAGAVWECFTFPGASSPGVFTTGTVTGLATRNGRQYLHLLPAIEQHEARGMHGAPVVVDGRVVGILESQGAILNEWFAIPLEAVSGTPIGTMIWGQQTPPPTPPAPPQAEPELDAPAFLMRLTDGARASLERAEAYRLALGQNRMHMEHLLLGLYGQPDSPMRRMARAAKVYDEPAFRKLLSAANRKLTPDLKPASDVKLTSLPTLSTHVEQAFIAAQRMGRPAIGRRSLIDGAFSVECNTVKVLRSSIPSEAGVVPPGPLRQQEWLPDVSTDIPGEKDKDLLNIERDVAALCSVIAAADAALPLSIGLFGDWGTGKSFFMQQMEQKLRELSSRGAPTYCSNIIQLKFNAWHYMDTSLWASLTSEIFEGLATQLTTSPGARPESKAAALLADMSTSREKLVDAERKKADAEAELAESERKLQEIRSSAVEVSPSVVFREAARLALEQDEVKKELDNAARELNLPQAAAASGEVRKELLELRGIGSAMLLAMRNTERLWLWLVALGLVIAAVFGLPALVKSYFPTESQTVKDVIAAITTTLGGLAALLGPFLVPARRALKYLQDARKKSEDLVRKEQQKQQKALDDEREAKQRALEAQNKNVEEARKKVQQLDDAIQRLRNDRQMLDFIQQRRGSSDYISHLGIIARAYKDFRELSALLERVRHEPPQPDLPRVERIVLYIDDLDRCPEHKVMDVLQAVHLLLAFPLFVVVVGVDPRWLLHSVAERSPALRRDDSSTQELWQSTPLNYLEKIFQIPFTLRPMTDSGFANFVDKIAGIKEPGLGEASKVHVIPTEAAGGPPAPAAVPMPEAAAAQPVKVSEPPPLPPPPPPSAAPAPLPAKAEPLKIEAWEREFMKRLYCLVPTPRAGKRLINIYRMIRSTVDGSRWEAFVGDEQQGGNHRQALLLLAILTGYPDQAAELLKRLIVREHNETWWEFVESLDLKGEGGAELHFKLQSLRALIPETEGCDVFCEYAPSVARYSFQSGRALLAQRLPEADN